MFYWMGLNFMLNVNQIKMNLNKMRVTRDSNRKSKVGTECVCPSCGSKFIKETYQQVFCKERPGTYCKDYYWNNVTPTKRNNTTRISPANERYYMEFIEPNITDDGIDYLCECGSRE